MATAAVISPSSAPTHTPQTTQSTINTSKPGPQDVNTVLHYHKPNEDGSPPHPTYVDRPETYDRPTEVHPVTVRDVRGREREYTLDGNGFQIHRQSANEKDFLDDDKIKSGYYAETEQLLKDVYVVLNAVIDQAY
jgi:hypothetical protein